jgi:preprotein translocase subunit SecE
MTTKTAEEPTTLDTLKLGFAVVLLTAAVIGFYWYAEYSLLYRVLGLLAIASVAAAIALMTAKGRELVGFLSESRTEVRKMVWPTRAETVQTTLIVFVMVILVGVLLWLLDLLLGWLTGFVIG